MAVRGNCANHGGSFLVTNNRTDTHIHNYGLGIFTENGSASSFCIYIDTNNPTNYVKLKIFRENGSYWDFVGGSQEFTISAGVGAKSFTLATPIDFQSGDVMGLTLRTTDSIRIDASGGGIGFPSDTHEEIENADITTDTLKSIWTHNNFYTKWGMSVTYTATISDKFFLKTTGLDTNGGQTWESAWKTVDKAANTLTDGQVVHIEGGTYNAEPAANDIAPVNAGTTGIKYTVWGSAGSGANDGTGTGTVTVEKNA